MPAERHFHAMGSEAHVIVVGGPSGLVDDAERRIAELERRWSRFVDDSEVTALNRYAGSPVKVSSETVELVRRAIDAWRLTHGLFDPTVLGAVLRAGYDRSFDAFGPNPRAGKSDLALGAGDIEIIDDMIRLPAWTGFDPGGVGKGLAADIVAEELQAAGAAGACVNLGGDVRVCGENPQGGAWMVAVDHPWRTDPITQLAITNGAAATSTTLRRSWSVDGERRHHLIDPNTGQPSTSNLTFVTVVSGFAWAAEILAKAVLLHGAPGQFDLLAATGAEALTIDDRGHVSTTPGMSAFITSRDLPTLVYPDEFLGALEEAAS